MRPRAQRTSPVVRSRGSNEPQTIDVFMTRVLRNVDRYARSLPPGCRSRASASTRCRPAPCCARRAAPWPATRPRSTAPPTTDTIYVAQQFAADLYRGVARGLPAERAGYGRAVGDFAVAYVLAHEYGHDLQQDLGTFDNGIGRSARPFELQADCLGSGEPARCNAYLPRA